MTPPNKSKPSLKAGKFLPAHSTMPPPWQAGAINIDPNSDEDNDDPSIYNHTIDGLGDGTHLIIASFIKINNKIRDQLVTNFGYFSELMHANIDGLQIHPLNTDKSLPILTSPTNKNIPTTGTKCRDYLYIHTHNKPKTPPQKVDDDARLHITE